LGGIDTTQLRHREIEDHDVRFQFERLPHGLTAVGGFADHLPTGLRSEPRPTAQPPAVSDDRVTLWFGYRTVGPCHLDQGYDVE
jgi:hypothetical protein